MEHLINIEGKNVILVVEKLRQRKPSLLKTGDTFSGIGSGYLQTGEKVSLRKQDKTKLPVDVTAEITGFGFYNGKLERLITALAFYSVVIDEKKDRV